MTYDLTSNVTGEVIAIDDDLAILVKHAIEHDGERWEFRQDPKFPDQRVLWVRPPGQNWRPTIALGYGTDEAIMAEHADMIANWYGFTIGEIV